MRIFGLEIRRISKIEEINYEGNLHDAIDNLNDAWFHAREAGLTASPWIVWPDKEIVLAERETKYVKRTT